jgi:hypothetical protein
MSVTRMQWEELVSQFYEVGWLLAVLNTIHSVACQAGMRSRVLQGALTLMTTLTIYCRN